VGIVREKLSVAPVINCFVRVSFFRVFCRSFLKSKRISNFEVGILTRIDHFKLYLSKRKVFFVVLCFGAKEKANQNTLNFRYALSQATVEVRLQFVEADTVSGLFIGCADVRMLTFMVLHFLRAKTTRIVNRFFPTHKNWSFVPYAQKSDFSPNGRCGNHHSPLCTHSFPCNQPRRREGVPPGSHAKILTSTPSYYQPHRVLQGGH